MPSTRFYGLLSTVLLVVGALAVGQALHLTVVTGQVTFGSPAFVLQFGVGLVLIALGYRARRPVAEDYGLTSDDREDAADAPSGTPGSEPGDGTAGGAGSDVEFDPTLSPLGDATPGDAERDYEEGEHTERDRAEPDPTERRDGEDSGRPSVESADETPERGDGHGEGKHEEG